MRQTPYHIITRKMFLDARAEILRQFEQIDKPIIEAQGVSVFVCDAGEDIICDACNGDCREPLVFIDPNRQEPICQHCIANMMD